MSAPAWSKINVPIRVLWRYARCSVLITHALMVPLFPVFGRFFMDAQASTVLFAGRHLVTQNAENQAVRRRNKLKPALRAAKKRLFSPPKWKLPLRMQDRFNMRASGTGHITTVSRLGPVSPPEYR
jgi:hypothetical protein